MSDFDGFKDNTKENKTRRKLTIISQTPTEMVVDIDRIEEVSTDATKLNATNLNEMVDSIKGAVKGCVISVNETEVGALSFNSDPQEQITNEITNRTNADSGLQTQNNMLFFTFAYNLFLLICVFPFLILFHFLFLVV
ncbi:MAG: hypothetical protein J6C13_01160 [Clostridia bacterium]|nr:hypothetical protein [Clostridia bacterium]